MRPYIPVPCRWKTNIRNGAIRHNKYLVTILKWNRVLFNINVPWTLLCRCVVFTPAGQDDKSISYIEVLIVSFRAPMAIFLYYLWRIYKSSTYPRLPRYDYILFVCPFRKAFTLELRRNKRDFVIVICFYFYHKMIQYINLQGVELLISVQLPSFQLTRAS